MIVLKHGYTDAWSPAHSCGIVWLRKASHRRPRRLAGMSRVELHGVDGPTPPRWWLVPSWRPHYRAAVTVTLEIAVGRPAGGACDQVVRAVTENCRTLKFEFQGFERSRVGRTRAAANGSALDT